MNIKIGDVVGIERDNRYLLAVVNGFNDGMLKLSHDDYEFGLECEKSDVIAVYRLVS